MVGYLFQLAKNWAFIYMTIAAYIPKGVIPITETVDIGSVTLVGGRDLIKVPALPALEHNIDHLHGPNPLDEGFATSTALIGSRSSTLYDQSRRIAKKNRSRAIGRLRDYLHVVLRFLDHAL
jgi:hypothetical protein